MIRLDKAHLGDIVQSGGGIRSTVLAIRIGCNVLVGTNDEYAHGYWTYEENSGALDLSDAEFFHSKKYVIENYKYFYWRATHTNVLLIKKYIKPVVAENQICIKCLLSAPHQLPNLKNKKYLCHPCVVECAIDNINPSTL